MSQNLFILCNNSILGVFRSSNRHLRCIINFLSFCWFILHNYCLLFLFYRFLDSLALLAYFFFFTLLGLDWFLDLYLFFCIREFLQHHLSHSFSGTKFILQDQLLLFMQLFFPDFEFLLSYFTRVLHIFRLDRLKGFHFFLLNFHLNIFLLLSYNL